MSVTGCITRGLSVAIALLAVAASASAGTRAYVGNFKDGTVSVVDTRSGAVTATVQVGAGPHGMAASADGRRVYVGLDGASTVAVIDTARDGTRPPIEVGKAPHGLAMTPDGGTLLVAGYGEDRVVMVDLAEQRVVGGVAVRKPHTIAIDPTGTVAYVASQDPSDPGLAVVDLATRTVERRIAVAKVPRDLEFGFDGRALYFTMAGENAVQVLDPATGQVVATVPTGPSPHLASVYRGAPTGLVVVQGPGTLLSFDAATHRPGASIKVGEQPHWMAPYDQGRAVAVTNEGSNTVSLVDLSNGAVRTIAVGQAPRKIVTVVVPDAAALAPATTAPTPAPTAADRPTKPAATPATSPLVSIADFAFRPVRLTIERGDSVTWRNDDGAPHGLQFDDRSAADDLLFPGKTFSRRFDTAGSFDYHCSVHPYMAGTIVVSGR